MFVISWGGGYAVGEDVLVVDWREMSWGGKEGGGMMVRRVSPSRWWGASGGTMGKGMFVGDVGVPDPRLRTKITL